MEFFRGKALFSCIIIVLLLVTVSCFISSMFYVLSLFSICTIVLFFMFFLDVRLSHLKKDYLLTYLICRSAVKLDQVLKERHGD